MFGERRTARRCQSSTLARRLDAVDQQIKRKRVDGVFKTMFPMTWRCVHTPSALRRSFVISVLICGILCAPLIAFGQAPSAILPPDYRATDGNFVNLVSDTIDLPRINLSIGAGASTLRHYLFGFGGVPGVALGTGDAFTGGIYLNQGPSVPFNSVPAGIWVYCSGVPVYQVSLGDVSDDFCVSGTNINPVMAQGSTLVNNSNGTLTYTERDGTAILYGPDGNGNFLPTQLNYPDGRIATITYLQAVVSGPKGAVTYS
jgi:hypothetical protein